MNLALGNKTSALLPVIMSLAALLLVGIQLAVNGMRPQSDEGALAHVYQLLLLAQLPVIAFFVLKWARQAPRQAITVILVQGIALATALIPVRMLGW